MFLNPNDFSESRYSMDYFNEWAEEISSSYFNSGCLPTATLQKIAQSEELVPHQIELLAANANKVIHAHKYANMEEKYFAADFPLADAKQVINSLQCGNVKVASGFVKPKFGLSDDDIFGVKPEELDKTAQLKGDLRYALEGVELLNQKAEDTAVIKQAALESAERQFVKMARQLAIEDSNSAERMKTLGYLDHFVKEAGYAKIGKRMLAKVAFVLTKEGKLEPKHGKIAQEYFSKEADLKAPEELISPNLNVQIVNGTHPLYITLKTIGDNEAEILRWNRDAHYVQDKARILKQKIRAL